MPSAPAIDQTGFRRILIRNITLPLAVGVTSAAIFVALIFYLISVLNWVEHTERVIGNTHEIGKLSVPGSPLYGIEHSNDGLITFPGGLPIVDNEGMLVGAIGVSGDTVENDHIVAQAGVDVAGVCDVPKHPWRT